jgi:signal transduction histidine kinase
MEEAMDRLRLCLASFFLSSLHVSAHAGEFGTRSEAMAMVQRVVTAFDAEGPEATFAAITAQEPRFKDRDLYPFVYEFSGLCIAHGASARMVGKNWTATKDQDGNPIIQNLSNAATGSPGGGWSNFKWPHPISHKIVPKSAYVKRLNDKYFVGVGVYDLTQQTFAGGDR